MRIWSWIALVLVMIGMTSCCSSPKEYHYPLQPQTMLLTQYGFTSKFRMLHSTGRVESFSVLDERHEEVQSGSCSNCCSQEFKDVYFVMLKAETLPLQIKIELSQTGIQGTYDPAKIGITINDNGVFYADLALDGMCANQPGLQCHDTMTIANNLYYGVFEFANQGTSQATDLPQDLFFNASVGMLAFTTSDGANWKLLR